MFGYHESMASTEPIDESTRQPAVSWEFSKLLASEAVACGLLVYLHRQGGWRDVWKFLSGAFFVSAGVLYYLAAVGVSVPILGIRFIETPRVSAIRGVAHTAFAVACFYLGFIRKGPQH
jgi:hypothetical protein